MLTGIRNTFAKGIMRIVLVLLMTVLVGSFAVWGIGDIFRGGTSTTLANVGGTQISVQTFQTMYNREVQNLGRMLQRGVTPEQARAFRIDERVLSQLVTDATLDERGRQLGLGIDDDTIRNRIVTSPSFRGATGQFDRNAFVELLRQNGFTEQSYIDYERRLAMRQQIAGAISDKVPTPQVLVDALTRFQAETRKAQYLVIGARAAGDIAAPDAGTLQAFYETRRAQFRAPEFRKLILLTLSPADQAAFAQVLPEQVEAELARLREAAEKRTIQQITFPTPEEATAAAERLKGGLTFEALATERNISAADLTIGTLGRSEMTDPAVRDAAFALAEGEVSAPIRGAFGTVLVKVTKAEPFNVEAAREQARQKIAGDMGRTAVNEFYDKIERERSTGLPLADIATKVGLTTTVVDAVDAQGRDATGAQLNLVGAAEFLAPAFRAEVGMENDPAQIRQSGTFIWYEVAGVTAARDRPLEEVKDAVEASWREQEVKTRIGKVATDLTEAVRGGKPLAEAGQALGIEVKTTGAFTRTTTEGDWGAAAIQVLFATPKDRAANAAAADGIDHIVFVTTEIAVPENAALDARTRGQLTQSVEDDVLGQFISQLQKDFGSNVNRVLLRRAIGAPEGT
ncbi:SurA N-terminal domain-containing protein [Phreatobacter aquaticus]|nr:SurA N-terminal domain-containing protein [Phreatobacter aquaticus]